MRDDVTNTGWFAGVERRLVDRMAERDLRRLGRADVDPVRSVWLARTALVLLVLPVHLVSLAAALGGLVLLLTGDGAMLRVTGGVLLLVAYAVRPSSGCEPEHVAALDRAAAPALYGLLDEVAAATGAPRVDRLLVVDDLNAFSTLVGVRRRRVVGVGAPLWVAAPPQARVALLGHELGHFAHGDLVQGLWVGAAVETLHNWLESLGGISSVVADEDVGVNERLLLAPLRWVVSAYLVAIVYLNAPSHQRQEYLADIGAARAAGTEAAIAMLDVVMSDATVETALTRAAVDARRPDLWATLTAAMQDLSPADVHRRRSGADTRRARINDTHPTTPLRIRMLETRPAVPASVLLDEDRSAAIDAELGPVLVRAAKAAKAAGERIRYQG